MSTSLPNPVQYTCGILTLTICVLFIVVLIVRAIRDRQLRATPFVIAPYLQLGPDGGSSNDMELRWLTVFHDFNYRVVLRALDASQSSAEPSVRIIEPSASVLKIHSSADNALDMPRLFWSYTAPLEGLPADSAYAYEIWRDTTMIFTGEMRTRKAAHQEFRLAVVGDPGTSGEGQAEVAEQVGLINPDLLIFPGDIVYKHGLFSEYLTNFFPFQSKLLSRYLSATLLGNHDVTRPDFRKGHTLSDYPDSLAWYYVWSLPLNGPRHSNLFSNVEPVLGAKHLRRTFKRNVGERYPRMGNYSFDYGLAHIVVLDANVYMDWSDQVFRQWLQDDLQRSQAKWKIVFWHQPSFTSHLRHRVEQRMRLVADIIQNAGVRLVMTGHAHHYERSYPLNFQIATGKLLSANPGKGDVDGAVTLDREYDGVNKTRPNAPIYVVSGGGGAPLSIVGRDVPASSEEWQSFTYKLVFDRHSFTTIDVSADALTVRQISASGEVFDTFVITQ